MPEENGNDGDDEQKPVNGEGDIAKADKINVGGFGNEPQKGHGLLSVISGGRKLQGRGPLNKQFKSPDLGGVFLPCFNPGSLKGCQKRLITGRGEPCAKTARPGEKDVSGSALTILLTVMFVNMIGFGIIVPLLPFYAESFKAESGRWR